MPLAAIDASFVAAFGAGATLTNGVVSNISASSRAGAALGSTGTYTLSTLSASTYSATTATGSSTGSLQAYLGAGATNSTTLANATSTSAAGLVSAADIAAKNDTVAGAIYGGVLFNIGQISLGTSTTASRTSSFIQTIGTAMTAVNTASRQLGAAGNQIWLQSSYISSLSDSLTSGVGSLADADMNEASTRLSALQTQQQLGTQVLSVAN